mmetsp:Transcript_42523/g.113482  ORF Transcript_42523/g.113482 Transcript_42523/m.113482 type:complete len:135 (-) Transcript_42523:1812-2216(-)
MPLKAVTIFVDEERVPHVVQDLTTRHHAEVLLHIPHDDGVGHGAEQSLCARAASTLESMTGVTMPMVVCELPIEVLESMEHHHHQRFQNQQQEAQQLARHRRRYTHHHAYDVAQTKCASLHHHHTRLTSLYQPS